MTTTEPQTCTFAGCHQPATMRLTQTIGKRQVTNCCAKHAPKWATTGKPSLFEQRTGLKAHTVEAI